MPAHMKKRHIRVGRKKAVGLKKKAEKSIPWREVAKGPQKNNLLNLLLNARRESVVPLSMKFMAFKS